MQDALSAMARTLTGRWQVVLTDVAEKMPNTTAATWIRSDE